MASILIYPLPDLVINTLEDLRKENYTLVYSADDDAQLRVDRENAKYKNYPAFTQLVVNMSYKSENYLDDIMHNARRAYFGYWTVSASAVVLLGKSIETRASADFAMQHKVCRLGKELMYFGQFFYGFGGPNHEVVVLVFKTFFEAGIVQLWTKEYSGLAYANRVQERILFKSGKIHKGLPERVEREGDTTIRFNSRMNAIMYLCTFCWCFSGVALSVEIGWNYAA